jgi:hypothetical protein
LRQRQISSQREQMRCGHEVKIVIAGAMVNKPSQRLVGK